MELTQVGRSAARRAASRAPTFEGDARALEAALREAIEGEVRFDAGSRALWTADASNYRFVPIGVVLPRTKEDVVATVAACRAHGAPLLSRGGGTSLAGQCANVAVVLDFSKYLDGVLEIDAARRQARVLPGTILDRLRGQAQARGLTFGPDPATHSRCTLGGMIGNNACGIHGMQSEFYGPGARTEDNVRALEVLTYDGLRLNVGPTSEEALGRIIAGGGRRGELYGRLAALRDRYADVIRKGFPKIPRRVSGYNLEALLPENGFDLARALTGTEGTCVTILEATVALIRHFPERALLVLGYPSVYEAADHVMALRALRPIGLEGMDDRLIGYMRDKNLNTASLGHLPEGRGWMLVEFGGDTREEAEALGREAMGILGSGRNPPTMALYAEARDQEAVWEIRESGLGATAFVPGHPDTWPGWEDSAVPTEKVGDYLRALRGLFEKYGYDPSVYGHFGQGCIHTRVDFDLRTSEGIQKYRRFTHEAAELVVSLGGSLSGEHGDGQARADLLPLMFGPELLRAFTEFKEIWDPDYRMNPGKVVAARSRTDDLRLQQWNPRPVKTTFSFPHDGGDLGHATLRCVGVGKCRRVEGGTMCPSYMVLKEEKHTTRGRAHLLWEMLQGEVIKDGWESEAVKESLDLCLSCKGCTGECPVNVDIPTLKAEFLSHYYETRRRPLSAYLFGWIMRWARLGSAFPAAANFLSHAPLLAGLAKAALGVHPERDLPRFAPRTFRSWYFGRGGGASPEPAPGPRVILWADTFNEHFTPGPLAAAVEVLEAAGCEVVVPRAHLCCGRPLYEFGMLDRAKKLWRETLHVLAKEIDAGTPVVGLEPSCVSAFRDELPNLFPDDPRAARLSAQTFTLGEFLTERLPGYAPPTLRRKGLLQGHCHHKAILNLEGETGLLERMGMEVEVLDSGCCGMAGSFGFEKHKYEVSMAAGERVLLPAVRNADAHTFVIADGFSCREQVHHGTGRRPLHLSEVMQYALHEHQLGVPAGPPEEARRRLAPPALNRRRRRPLLLLAAAGVLAALWLRRRP